MAKEEYLVLSVNKDDYENRGIHDFYVCGYYDSMTDALQIAKTRALRETHEVLFVTQVMSVLTSDVTIKEL